jgi:hypothetical protein
MRRLTMVGILVAAALVAGCGADGDNPARAVEVPDLIGMQYRPAIELLAQRGLRWKYVGSGEVRATPPPDNIFSTADDDFIVEQEPDAGEPAARGTVIAIAVSCQMEPLPPNAICID